MSAALTDRDAELVAVTANPIDAVWTDRPAPSPAVLTVQDDAVAGESSAAKRARIGEWLAEQRADAVVLSALDSIAWALNVRGTDVAHTPVALSYAIVHADGETDLFVAPEKITPAVRAHLGNAVRLHERSAFEGYLGGFAGQRVVADPERAVAAIAQALEAGGAKVLSLRDPVVLTKAIKNPAEVAGHRAASIRDGAAMVRFLRWVESECPKGGQTELSAAARLLACREATGLLKDTSFATISATGAHGASPHYHVTEESNAGHRIGSAVPDRLRGPVSGRHDRHHPRHADRRADGEMRDRFTRVLKGHIGLATAVFPDGTLGGHLDSLARRPLWEVGLDYAHGTGHGVGAYLSVHEGRSVSPHPTIPAGRRWSRYGRA